MQKDRITINLLPIEFTRLLKEYSRFYRIQTISISIILFLFFLTSVTIALRIFQSQQIQIAQAGLSQYSEKVSNLAPKEASLVILKNRLDTLDKVSGFPSKQRAVYNLVANLLPASITVSSISVDRNGEMSLTLVSQVFGDFDVFLSSLTDKETNEDKISKVSIDSLSRARDGIYRANIKVTPK